MLRGTGGAEAREAHGNPAFRVSSWNGAEWGGRRVTALGGCLQGTWK